MDQLNPVTLWTMTQELLGGLFPVALAVAAIWLVVLIVALRSGRTGGGRLARRLGVVALIVVAVAGPYLTSATFGDMRTTTDFVLLAAAAVAAGIGVNLLVYPFAKLLGPRAA